MNKLITALLLPLLLIQTMPALAAATGPQAAKIIQLSQEGAAPLTNQDVLRMVEADFTPETILATIKTSPCDFVTTPAALQHLKEAGVPDAVILAMVMSPRGVAVTSHASPARQNLKVKIPNGVTIEVEAPFTVTSQEVKKGEAISFRVVNPVKVDGVVVIEAGATATARVVKASRGGHFGRAGRLAWEMQDVMAVDGTRIPLQSSGRIVGDSKGAKVATAMVITAVALPLIAPVALLHGFKRGENAILPAGKRFEVLTQGGAEIKAESKDEGGGMRDE
ncbi:MAG TPA: hypothetical protein VJ715_13335 [Pyrinomonadaceae bacterium]|nr:hypothetical protein [Pyrinomonadaceae bacterium]